jgi:hypothetical protein
MKIKGVFTIDPQKYPHEYYALTVVVEAMGLSRTHLRQCPLPKCRFSQGGSGQSPY